MGDLGSADDSRSEFARRYDEGIDHEGGDDESADRLLEAMFHGMAARGVPGVPGPVGRQVPDAEPGAAADGGA